MRSRRRDGTRERSDDLMFVVVVRPTSPGPPFTPKKLDTGVARRPPLFALHFGRPLTCWCASDGRREPQLGKSASLGGGRRRRMSELVRPSKISCVVGPNLMAQSSNAAATRARQRLVTKPCPLLSTPKRESHLLRAWLFQLCVVAYSSASTLVGHITGRPTRAGSELGADSNVGCVGRCLPFLLCQYRIPVL